MCYWLPNHPTHLSLYAQWRLAHLKIMEICHLWITIKFLDFVGAHVIWDWKSNSNHLCLKMPYQYLNSSTSFIFLRYAVQYKMHYQAFSVCIPQHNCYAKHFKARFEKYGTSMKSLWCINIQLLHITPPPTQMWKKFTEACKFCSCFKSKLIVYFSVSKSYWSTTGPARITHSNKMKSNMKERL